MNPRALLVLGLALATSACVDATPHLFVAGVCGWPDDPTTCKAPAGKCDTYQNGTLFVYQTWGPGGVVPGDLAEVAQVNNQSPDNSNSDIGRVNTRDAIIESSKITYEAAGFTIKDADVPGLYTPVPVAGTATIFIPIMNAATVKEITGLAGFPAAGTLEVVAHIVLKGHYTDGSAFEISNFDAPVAVIKGSAPTLTCADPTKVVAYCPNPGQTASEKCVSP